MKRLIFLSLILLSIQAQASVLDSFKNALKFEPKAESIANNLLSAVLQSNADKVYEIIVINDIKDKELLEKCLNLAETTFKNGGHKFKGLIQILYGIVVYATASSITNGVLHLLKIAPLLDRLVDSGTGFEDWVKRSMICINNQTAASVEQNRQSLKTVTNHIYNIYSWYLIWNGIKIFRKQGKIDEMFAIKSFLQMKLKSLSETKA